MHDDVVADQAHIGAAFHGAVGDAATRDLADLGDVEHFQDQGIAEHGFAQGGREQAGHRLLHVIHEVVDDVVVADLDAVALGGSGRFLVGTDREADDGGVETFRQRDVGFRDAADARMQDARGDFVGAELLQRAQDRFERALHVGLDDQREVLATCRLQLAHHLLERAAHAGNGGGGLLALLMRTVAGDFAGAGFVLDHGDAIAGFRRAVEAEHFDRHRGAGFGDGFALVVDQRTDAAHFGAGDDDVAHAQGAALNQHGGDRTPAAIELGFDHGTFGRTVGVGLEVEQIGLQRHHFQELVEVGLVLGGHFDVDDVAAEGFDLHFVLQQLGADALGLGVGLVHLVDRHDHRHLGRLGVVDRLDGLRHHAVIGGDDQDHDVGDLGAAGAHRGERGVARRIDEGDLLAAFGRGDLIGADMLGDAAGFAGHHVGMAERVEQRGLAVIDVAHDGDDGRTRLDVGGIFHLVEQTFFHVGFRHALDGVAEFFGDQLGGVGVDHVGDLDHLALLHQHPDHVHGALGHAVGELLDGDRFRNDDFADQLFLRLVRLVTLEALGTAAERGDRTLADVAGGQSGDQRQAAALLGRGRLGGGFRRNDGARSAAGTPADLARTFILVGGVGGDARRTRRRQAGGLGGRGSSGGVLGLGLAETLLGFALGLGLDLFLDAMTLVLGLLAGFGGFTLGLGNTFLGIATGQFDFGEAALLGIAHARIGQRRGAGVALFFGQGAQHDAGAAAGLRR